MMKNINIFSIAFLLVLSAGLSVSGQSADIPEPDALQETYLKGSREEKRLQCSEEVAQSLGEECSFCHNSDVTDFTKKGDRAMKDMEAAVAIGVKCDYCHAGKKRYTEKSAIASEMFKLSELMDIDCNFCHAGRDVLTHKGKTAKTAMLLQEWATNGSRKCLECHVEKKQFELNFHGWEILNTQKGLLGM